MPLAFKTKWLPCPAGTWICFFTPPRSTDHQLLFELKSWLAAFLRSEIDLRTGLKWLQRGAAGSLGRQGTHVLTVV